MPSFLTLFYLVDSTFILYSSLSLSDESNYRLNCPKKITLTGPYMYMTVLVMKVWIQLTVSIVCCVFFSAMIATLIVRIKHRTNYFTVNTSIYKMRVKVLWYQCCLSARYTKRIAISSINFTVTIHVVPTTACKS